MKNKKLLFIGVLTAFLMLAVPFAVISFDADDVDANEIDIEPITDASALKAALEDTESRAVELRKDITITNTIDVGVGTKILKLNGYTLTSTAINLFEVNENNQGKFTIDGENGKIIVKCAEDTGKYPVGHASAGKDIDSKILFSKSPVSNFTLEVNGGTYSGAEYGFVLYSSNNMDNGIEATFTNVTIDARIAAIWLGNGGADTLTMNRCVIESTGTGLYLGSINSAILNNVKVNSTGTSLEIKSGTVQIIGGEYASSSYDVGNIDNVNYNGTGSAKSTVCINNAYQNIANSDLTNVIIADDVSIENMASEKSVVVYIDAEDVNKDIIGDVKLSWKDADDCVYDAIEQSATGKYYPTVDKPIVEGSPVMSESNDVKFEIDGTETINEPLFVELGVEDSKYTYAVMLPSGTEMSEGASITVDEVASGVYDIDFENIDTNGGIISVTLPFYGKPSDVPIVYYLDDVTGEQTPMETQLSLDGKSVVFITTHNSKYIVSVIKDSFGSSELGMFDSGVDSNIIYIAEIVLIVLALAGLVAVIRRN